MPHSAPLQDMQHIPCRLCHGEAVLAFRKLLLGKFMAGFYRCTQCGSLQSEAPHWLAEAYSPEVDAIDTGAAQRVLYCTALTHGVMRLMGFRTALDFGGGSGLLCRLLRDANHDAWWFDQYSSPGYATGFVGSPRDAYDLVTSFEVVEHFPNPDANLQDLFAGCPKAVLLMTEIYVGQGEEWPYLAPEEGQHIFFYSSKALAIIGARLGYHLLICRNFIIFLREAPTAFQRWVLQKVLRPRVIGLVKLILLSSSGRGAHRDYDMLSVRVSQAAKGRGPQIR